MSSFWKSAATRLREIRSPHPALVCCLGGSRGVCEAGWPTGRGLATGAARTAHPTRRIRPAAGTSRVMRIFQLTRYNKQHYLTSHGPMERSTLAPLLPGQFPNSDSGRSLQGSAESRHRPVKSSRAASTAVRQAVTATSRRVA